MTQLSIHQVAAPQSHRMTDKTRLPVRYAKLKTI